MQISKESTAGNITLTSLKVKICGPHNRHLNSIVHEQPSTVFAVVYKCGLQPKNCTERISSKIEHPHCASQVRLMSIFVFVEHSSDWYIAKINIFTRYGLILSLVLPFGGLNRQ